MADNIYRDITIVNSGSNRLEPAKINITYTDLVLENPQNYKMAIVNFDIPLQTLPLLVCPIVPNQANPLLTTLVCGVCESINPSITIPQDTPGNPVSLLYVNQNLSLTPPVQNGATQVVTPFYYINAYQQICRMINTALQTSFTAASSPGGAGKYPYIFYDTSLKIFRFAMPWEFVTATSVTGYGWTVFLDKDLYRYMNSFDVVDNGSRFDIVTNYASYNNSYLGLSPFAANQSRAAGTVYIFSQEYSTFDYMNNTRKIVILSKTMPVRKEFFPVPGSVDSPVSNSIGIVTDFNLNINNEAGANKSIARYSADGQYRFVDFTSTTDITTVDLEVYWADEFNNLTPVYLNQFDIITMKIGFFSKNQYSNESNVSL